MTFRLRPLAAAIAAAAAVVILAGCTAAPAPAGRTHSAAPVPTPSATAGPDAMASGLCSRLLDVGDVATAMDFTGSLSGGGTWQAAGGYIEAGGNYCSWDPSTDVEPAQRRQLSLEVLPAAADPDTTSKAGDVTCDASAWHECTVIGSVAGWVYTLTYGDQSTAWKQHRDAVEALVSAALRRSTPATHEPRTPVACADTSTIPMGEIFDGRAVAATADDPQPWTGIAAVARLKSGYSICVWNLTTGLKYASIEFAPHASAWFAACAAAPDAVPVTVAGVKQAVAIPGTQSASLLCATDGDSSVAIADPRTDGGAAFQWTDDLEAASKIAPAALALASR